MGVFFFKSYDRNLSSSNISIIPQLFLLRKELFSFNFILMLMFRMTCGIHQQQSGYILLSRYDQFYSKFEFLKHATLTKMTKKKILALVKMEQND